MPRNIYKTADGTKVPGTTTITGQLDKPNLIQWAWNLGAEGKDWREARDSAGDRGTSVHDMIMGFWRCEEVAMVGDIETKCFEMFLKWLQGKKVDPVLVEMPLVSEEYKFGGQPDLVAMIDGVLTLLDIKTAKAIYPEVWYQLAGYDILLKEHGHECEQYQILRLGQDGSFEDPIRDELERERNIFLALRDIYYWRKA